MRRDICVESACVQASALAKASNFSALIIASQAASSARSLGLSLTGEADAVASHLLRWAECVPAAFTSTGS